MLDDGRTTAADVMVFRDRSPSVVVSVCAAAAVVVVVSVVPQSDEEFPRLYNRLVVVRWFCKTRRRRFRRLRSLFWRSFVSRCRLKNGRVLSGEFIHLSKVPTPREIITLPTTIIIIIITITTIIYTQCVLSEGVVFGGGRQQFWTHHLDRTYTRARLRLVHVYLNSCVFRVCWVLCVVVHAGLL